MSYLINPFRFGGGGGALTDEYFAAYHGSFSTAGDVTGWTERLDPQNAFNPTTGVWTVPKAGKYLVTAGGSPYGNFAQDNLVYQVQLKVNGVINTRGANYVASRDHGGSALTGKILDLALNDALNVTVVNDGIQFAVFHAIELTNACMVTGIRDAAAGAAGDVITGYTEQIDEGGDFNPTTGIFTAPSAGQYLIKGQGYPDPAANTGTTELRVLINGSEITDNEIKWWYTTFDYADSLGFTLLVDLAASDEVKLQQIHRPFKWVNFTVVKKENSEPAFSARSPTGGGGGANLTGFTEILDTNNNFAASTGVFTAPADGIYLLSHYSWGDATSAISRTYIKINGTVRGTGHVYGGNAPRGCPSTEIMYSLSSGDTVTFDTSATNRVNSFVGGWRVA